MHRAVVAGEITDIRSVFGSPDRPSADRRLKEIVARYAVIAPKLAVWMEKKPAPRANHPEPAGRPPKTPPHHQRTRTGQTRTDTVPGWPECSPMKLRCSA